MAAGWRSRQTPADRRHRRHLLEDVRAAKEMLSRAESATVPVPLLEQEVRVTRDEFDALARPLLERTINTTLDVIRDREPAPGPRRRGAARRRVEPDPAGRRAAARAAPGSTPSTMDQPETVVAEGSVRAGQWRLGHHPRRLGRVPAPGTRARRRAHEPPVDPWAAASRPRRSSPVPTRQPVHRASPRGGRSRRVHPRAAVPTVPVPPQPRAAPPRDGHSRPAARYQPAAVPAAPALAGGSPRCRRPVLVAGRLGRRGWSILAPDLLDQPQASVSPAPPPDARAHRRTSAAGHAALAARRHGEVRRRRDARLGRARATRPTAATAPTGGPGVLRVQRDSFDVSGCVGHPGRQGHGRHRRRDRGRVRVTTGCGGMWIRTGTKGYFVAVCANGDGRSCTALVNDAPGPTAEAAAHGRATTPRTIVVVALAARATS